MIYEAYGVNHAILDNYHVRVVLFSTTANTFWDLPISTVDIRYP